jgi:hypothetical protein
VTLVWTPGYDDGSTYTPGKLVLKKESVPFDNDAWEYIARVETADGQILEQSVRNAITNFVIGCKADGIWAAIKASCILSGARTLTGALIPLTGTAPTNNNFVSGDYNRETGLVGDGSTKYLSANRTTDADPQNSNHISIFASSSSQAAFNALIGTRQPDDNPSARAIHLNTGLIVAYHNSATPVSLSQTFSAGFLGAARLSSASTVFRANAANTLGTETSSALNSLTIPVFARRTGASTLDGYTNARLAFYSIGESLDLALLDSRVTALINAFAASIP